VHAENSAKERFELEADQDFVSARGEVVLRQSDCTASQGFYLLFLRRKELKEKSDEMMNAGEPLRSSNTAGENHEDYQTRISEQHPLHLLRL